MINWLKRLIYGVSKNPEVPQSVDKAKVDNKVRQAKQPDGGKVPARKSNKSTKPTGVRSNNKGKTTGQRKGATVRAAAAKGKAKSKTVPKG